jgi:hypothetical protein
MDQSTEPANVDANFEALERVGELIRSGFADRHNHPFADDFVFHFFNAQLPDLDGDYHGFDGIAPAVNTVRPLPSATTKVRSQ